MAIFVWNLNSVGFVKLRFGVGLATMEPILATVHSRFFTPVYNASNESEGNVNSSVTNPGQAQNLALWTATIHVCGGERSSPSDLPPFLLH